MEVVVSIGIWLFLLVQVPLLHGLPMYSTRGTHYQVGWDVGRHFQQVIHEYYSMMTDLHTKLLPFVETPGGAQIYEGYFQMAVNHFPQYVEELRGIADGANLPFKQVFTNHIWDELSTLIGIKHKKSCTDIYIAQSDYVTERNDVTGQLQYGIGHNEDGDPNAKSRAYIWNVIIENNITGAVEENFTSFTYPGELPGDAYGFNMHGVYLTMNAVFPVAVGIGTVPRDFLLRATFAVRDQTELEALMLCNGTGVGYGYNLNFASNAYLNRTLVSYEVAPLESQPHALVTKYVVGIASTLRSTDHADTRGRYCHVNLYNHTAVDQIESDLTDSVHRQNRVGQLRVLAFYDLNYILGDTYDDLYPIYRTPRPTDPYSTLSTALFDLVLCRLYIYTDNPRTSKGPIHNITLPHNESCLY